MTELEQGELWKVRKLVRQLKSSNGSGTSLISLILSPKEQLPRMMTMLTDEQASATNIQDRVNRQSVIDALVTVRNRLKLYRKVPPNGLVIFCGYVENEGKSRMTIIDLEPIKQVNVTIYQCGKKFFTTPLEEMLEKDDIFGFIIMDGHGTLFATLSGNRRKILHKIYVDLPKKHGRGGQSALRFARLREEKRHNYVRKITEISAQLFLANEKPNVTGLILAGSGDFKSELNGSTLLDPRLKSIVMKIVDIHYSGESGFNEAINLASDVLAATKLVQEKKILQQYFSEIAQNSGKYCFGIDETMKALEEGLLQNLCIWENLPAYRCVFRTEFEDDRPVIKFLTEDQINHLDPKNKKAGEWFRLVEKVLLLDWLTENESSFGASLEIITDKSQEGSQFVRGFGGIGGIFRYRLANDMSEEEFDYYDSDEEEEEEESDEESDVESA